MAVAEDFLDLLPLLPDETEGTIRERWNAWANEGLTPEDVDEWVDTREGSHFYISSEPGVREAAKTYDLMGTEYIAATSPLYSWGTYLDSLAEGYTLERLAATSASGEVLFKGPEGTTITAGVIVGVESPVEGSDLKEYEVTESGEIGPSEELTLPVLAREAGSATDAGIAQLTLILSTLESEGEVTVENPAAIIGGSDPETDEALRERLLEVFEGQGPGTVHDYEVWARSYSSSIGMVTVIPVWDGPGSVKVIVLTADGSPVSEEVVEGLKAFLDPVAGEGKGQAPVGHTVTVETATSKAIKVKVKIEFVSGYSLDGSSGTTALEDLILASIADYINAVAPGDEIVRQKIIGRIAAFSGVHDVGAVTLNGEGANVVLDDDPAEVGELDEASELEEGSV
jgi:uncharacterized phage protein gp47/JayE